jgi:hypothetical protein
MLVAVQCMVAPTATASLFAFSLVNDTMGGKFMYVVLLTVVCFVLGVAEQLLCHTRKHEMAHRLPTNGVTDIHLTMIFMWITVPVLCTIFTIYQYHIYG